MAFALVNAERTKLGGRRVWVPVVLGQPIWHLHRPDAPRAVQAGQELLDRLHNEALESLTRRGWAPRPVPPTEEIGSAEIQQAYEAIPEGEWEWLS